jgi:hypothetical protein
MSFTIPPILVYIASWFGMMGGVWALFDRAEKVVEPKVKEKISNWMLNAEVTIDERWPATFGAFSDKIFGRKLVSIRSFSISALFSIVSVLLNSAIIYNFRHTSFLPLTVEPNIIVFFIFIFMGTLFFNFLQDFLSVMQTRYLLRSFIHNSTFTRQWLFLFLDFFLTSAVCYASILALLLLNIPSSSDSFLDMFYYSPIALFDVISAKGALAWTAPFVYSTYLTSVWIWIYVLSGVVLRLIRKFNWTLGITRKFLNIEEKPLQSIGFISMLIVTVVYIIIPFLADS